MTRQERKVRQAHVAVRVLATQSAKNAVRNHIRAQGWRVGELNLVLWLKVHGTTAISEFSTGPRCCAQRQQSRQRPHA
jgi:hypothetical protein